MNIYLVRHGQTFWNREDKIQTHSNGPENKLTIKGIENAVSNAKLLLDEQIELIYHSGLDRSIQTAEIIAKIIGCNTLIGDQRINDGCLGFLDGMTLQEFKLQFPKLYEQRKKDKFNYRLPNLFQKEGIPNQESMHDLYNRAMPVAKRIIEDKRNTLIVGHKSVNKVLLLYFLEGSEYSPSTKQISGIEMPNYGIYKVSYNPKKKKADSIEHNLGNGWISGFMPHINQ